MDNQQEQVLDSSREQKQLETKQGTYGQTGALFRFYVFYARCKLAQPALHLMFA